MTKDLAILIGRDQPWLNTQAFLAKIDENLQVRHVPRRSRRVGRPRTLSRWRERAG